MHPVYRRHNGGGSRNPLGNSQHFVPLFVQLLVARRVNSHHFRASVARRGSVTRHWSSDGLFRRAPAGYCKPLPAQECVSPARHAVPLRSMIRLDRSPKNRLPSLESIRHADRFRQGPRRRSYRTSSAALVGGPSEFRGHHTDLNSGDIILI